MRRNRRLLVSAAVCALSLPAIAAGTVRAAITTPDTAIVRAPTSLALTTGGTTFTYEPTIHVTADLGTTHTNRTVSIYAQWFGSKERRLLKAGAVNSRGELTVTYRAPHSTRFSAVFSGDSQYLPETVTSSVYVRARVLGSVGGYYASRRLGGVLYRLFRVNALLDAAAAVAPDKRGECVKFEVQEYYQGAWHPNVISPCVGLSRSSRAVQPFGLAQADIGYHYRVRAGYLPSATDQTNLSGGSSWLYFIVQE